VFHRLFHRLFHRRRRGIVGGMTRATAPALAVALAWAASSVHTVAHADDAPPTLSLPAGLKAVPLNPVSLSERPATTTAPPPSPIATAWLTLPDSAAGCDSVVDGSAGGPLALFCRASSVLPWKDLVALAPAKPFAAGPHTDALVLDAARDFGRYDPAFVRWATRALIPASTDPSLRSRTQALYERQLRPLARRAFLVEKALSASPAWVAREADRYRAALKDGGPDVWSVAETWGVIPGAGDDTALVRMTTMWWLRRHLDGTRPLWSDGLQLLLKTYDGTWLAAQIDVKPEPPATPSP
jgi:hypothetical protein